MGHMGSWVGAVSINSVLGALFPGRTLRSAHERKGSRAMVLGAPCAAVRFTFHSKRRGLGGLNRGRTCLSYVPERSLCPHVEEEQSAVRTEAGKLRRKTGSQSES